jgi:hypothetical protein
MVYRVDPKRVLYRYVDGEAILINVSTSYYYGLNSVGTFIWKLLAEKSRTEAELLDAVRKEYKPPMDAASRDLDGLLRELKDQGLLIVEE